MQCIGGFLFLFVYDMRINLRGFDVVLALYQRCTLKDDISYLLPT